MPNAGRPRLSPPMLEILPGIVGRGRSGCTAARPGRDMVVADLGDREYAGQPLWARSFVVGSSPHEGFSPRAAGGRTGLRWLLHLAAPAGRHRSGAGAWALSGFPSGIWRPTACGARLARAWASSCGVREPRTAERSRYRCRSRFRSLPPGPVSGAGSKDFVWRSQQTPTSAIATPSAR